MAVAIRDRRRYQATVPPVTLMADAGVVLMNPKFPHNVGAALRAGALLGAQALYWTGNRVPDPEEWPEGARLPREERMKCYERTALRNLGGAVDWETFQQAGIIPVCVEITDSAEDLRDFYHPERALYVFGPEDSSVHQRDRRYCHRFVRIPVPPDPAGDEERTPFNLAAAVNIVLWDRWLKRSHFVLRDDMPARLRAEQAGRAEWAAR